MKGKSITFNKYFVYVMILVATLILCVATFSLLGINKAFTPSAEGEVVTSVTSSLEDDNLTVEGLGTHYFKDDAVFTITTKESASGLTLIGVNATYTTGDNAGKVVTLAKEGSTYALYGVTGDFTLKGNWVAKSFTATWTISNGTIYNQDGTALDINMPIYYGIGIPAVDMPYVDAAGNRYFDGWKVTGERVNTTTNEISTYSASYIPKNAISATCSAPTIDVSTYNTQNFTNDDGSGSLYYDSEDHVKGVVAAGGLHNDCKDTNDDSTKDVSTATKLFKQGHLYSGQTDGSMSGLGVAKYGSKAGFYAYAMIIPVRFDGKIRQDILSGKLKNPNITINAQLKAGTQKNNTSNYARTSMWIDVSSSIITSLTFTNNKSLSDGCITSTNYPGGAHTITGSNKDGVAISAFNARNSSGWAIANSPTGGYTKTVPLYDADHPSPNGFVIGIWIHLYSDGASRHFAIVKSIDYTVTGNDGYTATYTLNLDSNSPEEGLESELISSNAFTRDSWMVNETPFEYEGYNFKGWSTEKGGEIISDSLKVLEGQTETTYYANWEKKNYAYVTAEDYTDGTNNVSEVLSTEIKEHGTSVTVPNRNEGDKYIGFNYDGLSPSGVSEGDTIPLTGSMRIGYKYSLLSPEVVFNDKEVTYGERINLASLTEITSNPLEGSTRTNRYTIAYTLAGNPVVEEDLILVLDSGEYLATLVTSVDIVALSGEIITLSTSHSDTANLNISKRVAQIVWPETLSFTYDATEKAVPPTISNVAFEDDVTLTVVGSTGTDASDYCSEITAISDADNYALPLEGLTKEWSILARELTVSEWVVTNGIGEEATELIYDGKSYTAQAIIENAVTEIAVVYENEVNSLAGTYTAKVSLGDTETNYVLDDEGVEYVYVIAPRMVEVSWDYVSSFTYDATEKKVGYTFVNKVSGDSVTLTDSGLSATNAGDYTAKITAVNNANYALPEGGINLAWTIQKRTLSVAWNDKSYTYNGQYQYPQATVTNALASENIYLTIVISGENTIEKKVSGTGAESYIFHSKNTANTYGEPIDAGSYTITFNESVCLDEDYTIVNNNYQIAVEEKAFTIAPKSISGSGNWSYDEDAIYMGALTYRKDAYVLTSYFNSGVLSTREDTGEKDQVALTYENNTQANAGTYLTTMSSANANYVLTGNNTIEWEILPLVATLAWTEEMEYTYDGTAKSVTAVVSNAIDSEVVTLQMEEDVKTDAGNYTSTIKGILNANYSLPTTNLTREWVIKKANIEGITLAGGTYTYDRTKKTATLSGTKTQFGEDVTSNLTVETDATSVGDHVYTAVLSAGDNYNELTLTATVVIEKADITGIELKDGTFTFDNTEKSIAVSKLLTQYMDGASVTYSGGENLNKATNAGEYTIVAIVKAGNNYNDLTLTATLSINKANVSGVKFSNKNVVYNATAQSISIEGASALFGEITYTINGEEGNSAVNVGTYTIVAKIAESANYNEGTISATLTINKATIEGFSVEDATYTYNKEEKTLAVVGTTTQYGDEVTIANGSVAGTNAGNYILSAIVSSANYEDLTLEATLTIEKADIEGITLVGGTYTYDKEEKVVTLSKEATQYGDEVEVVITGDSAVNAGTYTYTAVVTAGDNYNELSLSTDVIIEKKNISVIGFTDGTTTYGVGDTISYTYSKKEITLSAVYGEDDVIVGDEVSFVVSGHSAINAGKNTLKVTLEENENYNMSPVTKAWSIAPKTLEVEWIGDAKVGYNGEAHEVEAILVGVIEGDEVELTTSGSSNVNAGSYTAKAISLSNNNYTISASEYKYEIEKAIIKGISLVGLSTTYTGEQFSLAISDKETQFGDAVSVSYKYVYGDIVATEGVTEAGDYEVTATVTAGANYEKLILSARLTLKPVQMESEEGATIETEEGFTPGTVLKTKTKLYSANEKSEYVVELSETERIALAIEVSLTRNDVEVTPEGIMVLRLALPEEMQNVEFRMLAILGNETVEIEYAIEDDCVVVETDELCTYVFVTEYTTTEKLVAMLPYIIGGIVALALVIGVVIIIVIRSKKHTIKFVSNGVELKNSLGDITAKYGQKVSLPTPAVGGMYFEGCYSDPECTKKAKVSDLRDGDAQFYSKRVKTPRGNIKVPQAFLDTVKFGGWYLDEGCTIKADLNKMGKKDVTLYAKWSKKSKKSSYKVYPWEK